MKCYDWAIAQREAGNCVISGFHSQIEKDVFHHLLKGKQPVILVLARGMKKQWDVQIEKAINDNRLLIITPFEKTVTRPSNETALISNKLMAELADEIVIGYAQPDGNISKMISGFPNKKFIRLQ